jgi:transcription elongation factor GreA
VTQQTSESVTWLTQGAYDRLREELAYLTGEGRAQIVRRIESARDEGDLRENGGYHAAKEEQGKQEARIRQLQALLQTAKVGEAPADDGVVEPGMLVTVRLAGDEMRFLLGSREVASDDIEVYSEKSPLGGAINGRRVGDTASYTAPSGRQISVEILDARPFTS